MEELVPQDSQCLENQLEQYDISQCLNLSLSKMIRNEPMLISASFFWSDAINAFMFSHGLMTPTLLDVMMLTGLNIHAPDRSFHLLEKASFKIETKSIARLLAPTNVTTGKAAMTPVDANFVVAVFHES